MQKQNDTSWEDLQASGGLPEQLDMFKPDPVCVMHGCQQQKHLRSIRQLQDVIAKLEEKLRGYEQG